MALLILCSVSPQWEISQPPKRVFENWNQRLRVLWKCIRKSLTAPQASLCTQTKNNIYWAPTPLGAFPLIKAILRSSCLCLFYLVQTFIKSLLYVTCYSRSFCVCRLSQPIPIQIYTSLACEKYFCVSFVFLQKMCIVLKSLSSVLPKLGPAYPHPQGSLCLFFPTSTLPIPPKPPFRRFSRVLTSCFTGLPANASSFSSQLTVTSGFQSHCPIIEGPTSVFASYSAVRCNCRDTEHC